MASEQDRIAQTLTRVLRSREVETDPRGFVAVADAARVVGNALDLDLAPKDLSKIARRHRRFDLQNGRVRARERSNAPDIVYHACTQTQVDRYLSQGSVRLPGGRPVFMSDDESQAWRAAHRMGGTPRVLYVDTARNRRKKLRLQRSKRSGLYLARSLAIQDVLNLQPAFAEQLSAGGIPVRMGDDGRPRMALIRVTRRSGVTWEVAKGKLEPGEPPEWAGVREVQEEMGISCDLEVRCLVGHVRYGFMAPGGLPRLKTIYLYLLEPCTEIEDPFRPATAEGIRDVRWFTPEEACRVVTHSSLRPIMRRARELVEQRFRTTG
ncbi:MAG: NUDIX domain-containing protein [Myxococcota bacterium]